MVYSCMNWWHLVTYPFQNKMYYNVKMSSRVRSPIDPENVPASKRAKFPLITAAVGAQRAMTQSTTKNVRTARETSFSNNSAMNINSGNSENNTTSNKKANSVTISTRKNAEVSARAASVKRNTPSLPRSNQKRVLGVTPGVRGTKSLANVDNRAFLAARAAANVKSTKAKTVGRSTRVPKTPVRVLGVTPGVRGTKSLANVDNRAANVKSTKAKTVSPKTQVRAKTVSPKTQVRANSDPQVEADAERISQMFPKNATVPKTKKSYVPILTKIIDNTELLKNREDLKDFLKFIYIVKSTDDNTSRLFGGKSIKDAVRIIWKHYKLFHKRSRGSDTLKLDIPISTNTSIITEFAYLMYLDMKHDNTIGEMSFTEFIKSDIVKTFFGSEYTKIKESVKSNLFKKLENLPPTKYESVIKTDLHTYFKTGDSIDLNNKQIKPDIFKPVTDICMLFDQEDEGITLSNAQKRLVYSYSAVMDKFIKIGQTAKNSKVKPFYNTVTIANLVDPGHDMQIDSAKKDSAYYMQENPSTSLAWNYRKPVFKIGKTTLTYKWDKNKHNFSIDIITDRGTTTVPAGITKGAAVQARSTNAILSKFLGDFMQILTTVALNKANTKTNYMYVMGTGDTMCAAIYSYICDITKTGNKLWFVLSKEQKSKLYGMDSVINKNQLTNNRNNLHARSRTTIF